MRTQDLRLVPVAVGGWAMALLSVHLPETAGWSACGAALLAVALVVLAAVSRRGRGRSWAPLAAVVTTVCAGIALTVAFASPARADAARSDGRVLTIEADITSSSSVGRDGRLWFDAQTRLLGPADALTPASVPVRIGVDPMEGADLGARIRVVGQVIGTDAGERAVLVVFVSSAEIAAPASGVFAIAADARRTFVENSVRLPEPGAGLLPGLAVGDTRAVTPELNADMLASGLSHLTAVSGANCAIVVAAVFWVVALCGGGRTLRVVLALGALAGFVVLVTPEPSVIRASAMAGLAMISVLLGRPSAGVSVLCAAVVGILLTDPWLSATPGFALSVAATGGLILLAPPLARGMQRWMPQPIALAIGVPLAAQLVCGPIIALFSEQQSLIGIIANLVAAPAAPIATVIGLLACLASPFPLLADLLTASAWLPAAWIATTATTTAALPGAQLLVVPGILTAMLVLVLSAALGALLWRSRAGLPPPRLIVQGAAAVLVVAAALGGARMLLDGPLAESTTPEGWSIAACDVGQGDALLVRSEGRIALVDTGPDPDALQHCLTSLGVEHLDLLVLTHFDLDHVGGTAAVVGRVGTVLHGPVGEPEDGRLLAELEASGAVLAEAGTGRHGALGAAQWRVLWPKPDQAAFPAGNDASVVIEFAGGEVPRSLFLGDLSAVPQQLLAASGTLSAPYAVVKVAHHGSADQDPGLYALLRPSAAIFSAGEGNDYGHPRTEALELLEAAGAAVLRTDQQGRVLIGFEDGALAVWTERSLAAEDADDVARPG